MFSSETVWFITASVLSHATGATIRRRYLYMQSPTSEIVCGTFCSTNLILCCLYVNVDVVVILYCLSRVNSLWVKFSHQQGGIHSRASMLPLLPQLCVSLSPHNIITVITVILQVCVCLHSLWCYVCVSMELPVDKQGRAQFSYLSFKFKCYKNVITYYGQVFTMFRSVTVYTS